MPSPSPTPTVPPPLPPSAPRWALELQDRILSNRPLPQDRFWARPEAILTEGLGGRPDPWQTALLRTVPARTLLLCSRPVFRTLGWDASSGSHRLLASAQW
jgi:hypothetical protein